MGFPVLKVSFEFSPKLGIRQLPKLTSRHESNVPGLFIVGDLADAPIIKVALNQGFEVARDVCQRLGDVATSDEVYDVIVVGAGPAGVGAALALNEAGARYLILEKERPFNTLQNYPKAKFVFSEPRTIENKGGFWFEDATKEDLLDRWEQAVEERSMPIQQPEGVVDIQRESGIFTITTKVAEDGLSTAHDPGSKREGGATNTYRARRVILAIGRRGTIRKLGIPGEELDKVAFALKDPAKHKGERVVVVGGGDSAVEAACSMAEEGAEVTISYRKDAFSRAKLGNQKKILGLIEAGRIRAEFETAPVEITRQSVILKRGDERIEVPNDKVFVFIGTLLPAPFLKRVGIKMAGEMDWKRALWVTSFALLTYMFYVLKSGLRCDGGTEMGALCEGGQWVLKKPFFPFGPGHLLGWLPPFLKVDLGFRTVDGSFWGTLFYSAMITVFGIMAYRRYTQREQKKRYISLIVFQMLFLFGIPELIAPFLIHSGGEGGLFFRLFGGYRGWKFYSLSVPWPLSIWSVVDHGNWTQTGNQTTALVWIGLGLISAFVFIPLYVRKHGLRFCSYMCGCGGLAETLGDMWRHLSPRGSTSYKAERMGPVIFLLAIPVTLLIVNDTWRLFQPDALSSTKLFAERWYGLMVDFWLASVIGVAFYPYLGNRVWCRFFCPLRAWMQILARWFGRITIKSNDKCIGCGECTRYCQMGIPVQTFAQRQVDMDNSNSECIQCGICVQVCPMDVLSIGERAPDQGALKILESPFPAGKERRPPPS